MDRKMGSMAIFIVCYRVITRRVLSPDNTRTFAYRDDDFQCRIMLCIRMLSDVWIAMIRCCEGTTPYGFYPWMTQYTPGSVTKLSTIPYPSNEATKRCSSPAIMASIAEEIIGPMAASKMLTFAARL